jgi:alkylation response protein AidB-like acyl-CoA dehydrogenase
MRLPLDEVLQRTREIARTTVAANAARTDEEARWPAENFRALLDAGLGGLVVPASSGGLGMGLVALSRVCEALAYQCPSTAISFGMHHVASAVLAARSTPGQRERYLAPIVAGRHLTTLALSEPGTGAHFYLPQTRLEARPDGSFVVNGAKSFVTNGGHADSYVVSTNSISQEPRGAGQFSCVVIPKEEAGLEWQGEWSGLGMRGNSSRAVALREVRVPPEALLGSVGDQVWFVFQVVAPYFLTAMAGTYLGLAAAALEEAIAHLKDRAYAHTGNPLAQQPVLQHRLGVLWARVASTRAFVHHAAALGDAGDEDALAAVCSAKAEVAECAVTVTNEVMTLLGGQGYGRGTSIDRRLRDARAAHVMAPTTDILRGWVGRAVLGLPLLAE